jgi:hypothetical protein
MMECSSPLPVHADIRISCSSSTNSPSSSFADGFLPLAASELFFIASRIRTLRLAGLCSNILHVLDRLQPLLQTRIPHTIQIRWWRAARLPPWLSLQWNNKTVPNLRRLTFVTDTCINAPLWLLAGIVHDGGGCNVAEHAPTALVSDPHTLGELHMLLPADQSAFIKTPAIYSPMGMYSRSSSSSSTFCSRKWYHTSMCFVQLWNSGFLAMVMADWLSMRRVVEALVCRPSSPSSIPMKCQSICHPCRKTGFHHWCHKGIGTPTQGHVGVLHLVCGLGMR